MYSVCMKLITSNIFTVSPQVNHYISRNMSPLSCCSNALHHALQLSVTWLTMIRNKWKLMISQVWVTMIWQSWNKCRHIYLAVAPMNCTGIMTAIKWVCQCLQFSIYVASSLDWVVLDRQSVNSKIDAKHIIINNSCNIKADYLLLYS